MEIDRRHVLIGVSALTLSNCSGRETCNTKTLCDDLVREVAARMRAFRGIEPDWNFGDDPWEGFDHEAADESPLPTAAFHPDYIAVLHLEVKANPFQLIGQRAHFEIDATKPNDLGGITDRVVEVIKHLNGDITQPFYLNSNHIKKGLYGFGFTRQHHFIIYIKNRGVSYDPDYPIWFGGKLIEPRGSDYRADPNRSFFDADLSSAPISTTDKSNSFVYIKNYFYTADETGNERKPNNRHEIRKTMNIENKKYSLNINAMIESSDDPIIKIPLVIDPDTGNMGGGGGGALP